MANFSLIIRLLLLFGVARNNVGYPVAENTLDYGHTDGLLTNVTSDVYLNGVNASSVRFLKMVCETKNTLVKNGWKDIKKRWKTMIIYVDKVFKKIHQKLIRSAIRRLQSVLPCVKFHLWPFPVKPKGDYVHIINGAGCYSDVGRIGGAQELSLNVEGCMSKATVMHELIHALGFHHEHCRPDRDEYVTIHEKNIIPEQLQNFEKLNPEHRTTFNVPYNERSIMHYPPKAFNSNGKPTITSKRNQTIEPGEDLQDTDILKLKRMYQC